MIQYMKELGMELREIQEVLASEDLRKIEAVLIKKREQTIAEIEQRKVQRDAIDRAIESMERYRKSPKRGTFTLELSVREKFTGLRRISIFRPRY